MYTQASVLLGLFYLLLCLRATGRLVRTVHTTRGYVPVRCTWYGYTYDDDEDDDMTRCRIHRDAALREAKEREREAREGVGKGRGKIGMAGTRVVRSHP